MPKKKGSRKKSKKKTKPALQKVTRENIDLIQNETVKKVSKTLSSLEVAIADWDISEEKPEELKQKFKRYKWLHTSLSEWEKKTLKAIGKKDKYETKLQRINEFVKICNAYGSR